MNNFFIIFYYFSFLQLLQSSLLFVYFFRSHIPSQASTNISINLSFITLAISQFYISSTVSFLFTRSIYTHNV